MSSITAGIVYDLPTIISALAPRVIKSSSLGISYALIKIAKNGNRYALIKVAEICLKINLCAWCSKARKKRLTDVDLRVHHEPIE